MEANGGERDREVVEVKETLYEVDGDEVLRGLKESERSESELNQRIERKAKDTRG
jgi:hypothetical protein